MSYTHLTLKQRFRLEVWSQEKITQKEMADRLAIASSTISREFHRNGGRQGYDARVAQKLERKRRQNGKRHSKKLLKHLALYKSVRTSIRQKWSPEQIVGRLRNEGAESLCHETIYAFIAKEKPLWRQYLRQKKGRYRRRWGTKKREKLREEAKKKRIDVRPPVVVQRERLGDWEGDTIIGGERTTGILTHVERKSGYLIADLLSEKTAHAVHHATVHCMKNFCVHTITYDNGSEFSLHKFIERDLNVSVYFAYPYHSWERGTNENTNGLLRQFFPKKMPFGTLTQKDIDRAVALINHRPRKRLGYLTPHEVFIEGRSIALHGRM